MKLQNNNNIFCSVSAGYSSVLMAIKMKEWYPDHNIIYGMANTSKERLESLEFMNECDKHYNLNLNWIEAEFHENGKGVSYKVVQYEDLKTNGEIFEEGIKKFGIPNKINKWCNRDMKKEVMEKFCNDYFGRGNYSIAVGIRIDEIDRVSKAFKHNNIFYPLIENKIDTRLRNKFWDTQPIQIKLKAYEGNCELCFAKSRRKLLTIITESPKFINWWNDMEIKYASVKIKGKNAINDYIDNYGGNYFYRDNNSIQDLIKISERPFRKATDEYIYENDLFDQEDECGSGCVVF